MRIDVSLEETVEGSGEKKEVIRTWQTFVGNEWDNKGESRGEGGNGLVVEVKVMGQKEFFQERAGCKLRRKPGGTMSVVSVADSVDAVSPISFLKNPMILMAVFSMALIFGMPYLMDNSKLYSSGRSLAVTPYVT
jgi:hypothetical protein